MRRYRRKQGGSDIWPGFVDALSSLLLVIIFLLVVFMLAQFYLSQALSGREEKLDQLTRQLNEITELLNLERAGADELRTTLDRVSSDLERSTAERDSLAARVSEADQRITALEQALNEAAQTQQATEAERARIATALESAETDKRNLNERLAELEERLRILDERLVASEQTADQRALALQSAGDQLADAKSAIEAQASSVDAALDRADRQKQRADAAEARVADMAAQLERLNQELARLAGLLDESRKRSEEQQATIADLGRQLNQALAAKVEELARYRSEFFGRLREVLGGRDDIQIVGDRFVFQSEVLFDSGSADVTGPGRAQLARLAEALNQIAGEIPEDINWVLQVDGHTDIRPISTPAFASNWELSAARAISVVKFLISQGVPPWRLSAAGYGEFHPIDTAETQEAYRRNRRIELKLTNK